MHLWTVIVCEGKRPKRAIGRFKTKAEAEAWAIADGWTHLEYLVIPFDD